MSLFLFPVHSRALAPTRAPRGGTLALLQGAARSPQHQHRACVCRTQPARPDPRAGTTAAVTWAHTALGTHRGKKWPEKQILLPQYRLSATTAQPPRSPSLPPLHPRPQAAPEEPLPAPTPQAKRLPEEGQTLGWLLKYPVLRGWVTPELGRQLDQ